MVTASEFKVIPMGTGQESGDWAEALNAAAREGWDLVATPATAQTIYAVMRRSVVSL